MRKARNPHYVLDQLTSCSPWFCLPGCDRKKQNCECGWVSDVWCIDSDVCTSTVRSRIISWKEGRLWISPENGLWILFCVIYTTTHTFTRWPVPGSVLLNAMIKSQAKDSQCLTPQLDSDERITWYTECACMCVHCRRIWE